MAAQPARSAGVRKSPEAFRTISEVSDELDLPQHVLRFWETRFSQIKPLKRGGGRRLYRPDHVSLLRGIKALLYDDGLTIKGVQKVLREQGSKAVIARGAGEAGTAAARPLPEDAPERLAALSKRHKARAAEQKSTPEESMESAGPDREKVLASIARLEDILRRLEARD